MHHVRKCNNVRHPYVLPDFWILNSPDLKTIYYKIWGNESTRKKAQDVIDLRRRLKLEWDKLEWDRTLMTMALTAGAEQRSLTISLAVWIQYTNVTDRQTDRHRATAKTAHTHSVAR